jgi:glycerol uptake operon antiterminator
MLTQSNRSLLNILSQCKTIPLIENRPQFSQVLDAPRIGSALLRHCNLFDFAAVLNEAQRRKLAVYVNIDHIDGVHADAAGLRYLAEHMHVAGIVSNHPRNLALARDYGLETIQRIFAVDSTGLEMALETVDAEYVDVLDISPALVVPHIAASLKSRLPLPFIASGLVQTPQQLKAVVDAGAAGVVVSRPELWL